MEIAFIFIYIIGWVAIFGGIIFMYTKYEKRHHIPELIENFLGLVLFIAFGFLSIILINSYEQKIEGDLRQTQMLFCLGTKRSDGELLTENQCEYFQDVLNGRYYEN